VPSCAAGVHLDPYNRLNVCRTAEIDCTTRAAGCIYATTDPAPRDALHAHEVPILDFRLKLASSMGILIARFGTNLSLGSCTSDGGRCQLQDHKSLSRWNTNDQWDNRCYMQSALGLDWIGSRVILFKVSTNIWNLSIDTYESLNVVVPGCRAPVPSKGEQRRGTVLQKTVN